MSGWLVEVAFQVDIIRYEISSQSQQLGRIQERIGLGAWIRRDLRELDFIDEH